MARDDERTAVVAVLEVVIESSFYVGIGNISKCWVKAPVFLRNFRSIFYADLYLILSYISWFIVFVGMVAAIAAILYYV